MQQVAKEHVLHDVWALGVWSYEVVDLSLHSVVWSLLEILLEVDHQLGVSLRTCCLVLDLRKWGEPRLFILIHTALCL